MIDFRRFFILLIVFIPFALSAQSEPTPIHIGPDAPEWFLMMQETKPNVRAIKDAYKVYYRDRKFEKNAYTNYYKRWMRWAREYEQGDGSLYFPSPEEQNKLEQKLLEDRGTTQVSERGAMLNPWRFVGPVETYDVDGITKVTWQTNCYSVDVSRANSSIIVAGGETGGLYRTTDKGLNWTVLTHGITHGSFPAVKNHPTDVNIFYAATKGKIVKSINGGSTLTTVYTFSSLDVNEFVISTTNPDIVIAVADEGMFRTTDGGATWTRISTLQTWTIKQKPGDGATFYAVSRNGTNAADFLISTDFGATWNVSNTGMYTLAAGEAVTGAIIAVCPSDATRIYTYFCGSGTNLSGYIGVYKSINSGTSWTNTHAGGAVGNSPTAYAIPGHVNLMTSEGLHNQLQQGFYDMAIFVNPSNADQIIAGGTSWWKSSNAGATWTALGGYAGGLSFSHPDIQWIDGVAGETWIASDGGLNYSTDFFGTMEVRMKGISGADMWGYDNGWNEDIIVGGRYHNGNMGFHQSFTSGLFYRLGGGEAATGYVNPGPNGRTYYSDINGKIFNGGFTAGVREFPIGDTPNEDYAYFANSEMAFHPKYYNTIYLGKGNKLRVSYDGGVSFIDKYTFPGTVGNEVYEVEICRSNPLVMYVSQWDGVDDKIWKSVDGGTTFTGVGALPFAAGNNNDRVKITTSATDPNVVWVAVTYGSNGNKICKSTNGGASWTNMTTTALNGYTITDILAQHGTDGGVYLGCAGAVFYRNNTQSNWQNFSAGLPLQIQPVRIKPFYRDGKVRMGSYGFGVWESNLYETSVTIAQAVVNKKTAYCTRDTFYFDDFSVVNHTGASWSWSFPGATTVIGGNTRNPKVLYDAVGNYTATMTLTTPGGSFVNTVAVEMIAGCDPDTIRGKALRTVANGDGWVMAEANLTNVTHFTVSGWWKPNGAQQPYSALFSSGDWCAHCNDTEGLVFDYGGNRLWYKWSGNASSWANHSGMVIPLNEWSYVALVITPTSATMYLNDQKFVHNTTLLPGQIHNLYFAYGHYDKSFKGDIDEVTMWNRALGDDEIRRLRHITREDVIPTDPTLIGYWQFNEVMPNGDVQDQVGTRHGSLRNSNSTLVPSTAPVGGGIAQLLPLSTNVSTYTFPQNETTITLGCNASGAGSIVATRLNMAPNALPVAGATAANQWLINTYSNATTGGSVTIPVQQIELTPTDAAYLAGISAANEVVAHTRTINADGTWATRAKAITKVGNKLSFDRKITIEGGAQIGLSDGAPTFIEVDPGSPCAPDSVIGTMIVTSGLAGGYAYSATAPQFGAIQDFSLSVWFKTTSTTTKGTIVSNKDWDNANLDGWVLGMSNGKIFWSVADGTTRIEQSPTTPLFNDGKWHHFIATCDRDGQSRIYADGILLQSNSMTTILDMNNNKKLSVGADDEDDYRMAAEIDEVNIYNRVLTMSEIRSLAHLIRTGSGATTGQIDYYQFNYTAAVEYDRVGTHHFTMGSTATRAASSGPFSGGISQLLSVTSGGLKAFTNTNLAITFPATGTFPNGDVIVNKLNGGPFAPYNGLQTVGNTYWVLNNHGNNATFTSPTSIVFSNLPVATNIPDRYKLYKRISNGHLVSDWQLVDIADAVVTGTNGSITFNTGLSLTTQGQLAIFDFIDELPSVNLTNTFIQGYLLGSQMVPVLQVSGVAGATSTQADTVTIALHQATSPYANAYNFKGVLNTNGTMEALFPTAANGQQWYVVIKGRNILETWSTAPVTISPTSVYAFSNAYGSNLGSIGGIPVIYSGNIDPLPDDNIDLVDYPVWEAAYNTFSTGYQTADLNGDGNVDLLDYPIWEANYNQFISVQRP
jgi:hypothetical protein